jgi:Na+-transporting NADH:ubiquinone oxidoreductase subunit NqrB
LAGVVFMGAIPVASELTKNTLRVAGALIGIMVALLLVEGLPALV